jgi:copper chaperone CopZ
MPFNVGRQQQGVPTAAVVEVGMSNDVGADQFAIIRIDGMHCHRCEQAIQKALTKLPGVHEVEVDFASKQASVLFDPSAVTVKTFMDEINATGYRAVSFIQRSTDPAAEQA